MERGLKEFNWRISNFTEQELPPSIAFELFTTYGFPFELIKEIAEEKGLIVDNLKYVVSKSSIISIEIFPISFAKMSIIASCT